MRRSLGGRPLGSYPNHIGFKQPSRGGFHDPTNTASWNFLLPAGVGIERASKDGAPALTFTRASAAWGFDESGLLVSASTNEPVFDHNFDGAALGLGVWEGRTGSALWVRDFTNVAWVKSNITPAKDATGLDGVANSASTLTATDGNGAALQTVTIGSAAYTHSVYVKRKTGTGDIDITDNDGTNWTTLTGLSSTTWTRHDITRTQANPVIGFRIVTSGDVIEVDVAGLENGSFSTPPIITTSVAVLRAKDICSTTDMSWFNASEGMILFEGRTLDITGGTEFLRLTDGTADEKLDIFLSLTNRVTLEVADGGVQQVLIRPAAHAISADTSFKYAFSYKVNDFAATLNGATVTADTSGTLPTLDQMAVGHAQNNTNHINGYVAQLKYWNVDKPDGFLENETA